MRRVPPFRDWPFAWKFAALLMVLSIIPLVLITLYDDLADRRQLLQAAQEQNLQQARDAASAVDNYLGERLRDARVLAGLPGVVAFVQSPQAAQAAPTAHAELTKLQGVTEYDAVSVTDTSGRVLDSTAPQMLSRTYANAAWFQFARTGQTTIDGPSYDPAAGQVYLDIAGPVRNSNGTWIGVVDLRIAPAALDRVIGAQSGTRPGAFGVLWDDQGIQLSRNNPLNAQFTPFGSVAAESELGMVLAERFGPNTGHLLSVPQNTTAASDRDRIAALAQALGRDSNASPYLSLSAPRTGTLHGAVAVLSNAHWFYGIFVPEATVLSGVGLQTFKMFLIALAAILAAVGAATVLVNRFPNPMRHVADKAFAIATGERSGRLRVRRTDEMGRLAAAFDQLADQMAESQSEQEGTTSKLKALVEERTAHLRASEAELRALFAAMHDVILVLDGQGRYVKIAPTNPSLLYRPATEMIGKTVDEIYSPEQARTFMGYIHEALTAGHTVDAEYSLIIEGREVWFAASISPMMENTVLWVARDITTRKERERELQTVVEVAAALRAARSRHEILPIVLDKVQHLIDVDGAALELLDPKSGEMRVELVRGDLPETEGLHLPIAPTGVTEPRGQELSRPNWIEPDPSVVERVPLNAQGFAIGSLWVGSHKALSNRQLRLLNAIADIAANAIHRATLHEQTEEQLDRLAAVRSIEMAITTSMDLSVTLDILLNEVLGQLHIDAADVLLVNPYTNALECWAARGFRSNAVMRARIRLGEGETGRAALERRTLGISDIRESEFRFQRAKVLDPEGFVAYFAVPLVAKGETKGMLEFFHRSPLPRDPEWMDFLQTLAGQTAIAIDNIRLLEDLQQSNLELALAYDMTLEGWTQALDLRDKETEGHTRRVTELTVELARSLSFSDEELVQIRRGALLHDIGKMAIPDSILLKPGPLTEEEQSIMRLHPIYAHKLLSGIEYLRAAVDIPYCHHEKWDGTGYPRGLKGEEIPLIARVFAVVDIWDALTSDRPYRSAWPRDRVRVHLRELSGTHLDPQMVDAFLTLEAEQHESLAEPLEDAA